MKSSLLFSAYSLTTSLTSSLEGLPWLEEVLSLKNPTPERKILGHARPQIENNLTYQPLKSELNQSILKNTRIYSALEINRNDSTASAFFRCFPNINLITLDLIYVPRAQRGLGIGYHLLEDMTKSHKTQHSVHLILDYANRKAFEKSSNEKLSTRLLKVPTLKNLAKLGFSELTHIGTLKIPGDKNTYPEVVLTKTEAAAPDRIITSLY